MKPTQLPLVKSIIDQMLSAAREVQGKTAADHVPVIQRVTSAATERKYIQLVTTVGVLSIVDSGKLTELDYPVEDIGPTNDWGKVSKGVITSKTATVVPITTAANVAAFADDESAIADKLLFGTEVHPPVSSMLTPGRVSVVFASNEGGSLTWAYDPTDANMTTDMSYTNMQSEWTRNYLATGDIYGIIRAWHRAVAYVFPKDASGQPSKIDGVAVARIGNRTGIRIISRELGMVASLACSHFPKAKTVTYKNMQGILVSCECQDNGTYTIVNNKEKENMNVKMIDISTIKQTPNPVTPPVPAASVAPVVATPVPEPEPVVVPATMSVEPSKQPETAIQEPAKSDIKAPEPTKTVDELFADLFRMQAERDEITKAIKATVKAIQKAYKAEVKDLKSNAKDNEELVKLRAAHKRLRALLDSDI